MKNNIIYIHTHDSGRYFEPYGAPVHTPELMRFSERATLFRNAHCAGPTCSPSRSALLTGRYPHCNGMLGLAHRGFKLNDYSDHMVSFFNKNGYETTLSGIQHVAAETDWIGYQRRIGDTEFEMSHSFAFDTESYDMGNAAAAADYIREEHAGPFFLSFGMFNTHRIFPEPDENLRVENLSVPATVRDTRANRMDMAGFHQSLTIVDRCVGKILDALDSSGEWNNSIVIFTTDHGMPFPGMKCNLNDTGTGVAFMMHYPGNPSAGKVCDAMISQLDLFPTLCDILDVSEPAGLQGRSFKPLFSNPEKTVRKEIFSEISFHAAYEPVRSIRTEQYRLVVRFDQDLSPVPANTDGCPAKQDLIESNYFNNIILEEISLYDLKQDPRESRNLADKAEYREVLTELREKLHNWMIRTDDPLIINNGLIPVPPGGMVNKRECIEPIEFDFIDV